MANEQWVLVEVKDGSAQVETNVDAEIIKVDWDIIEADPLEAKEVLEVVAQSELPDYTKDRLVERLREWIEIAEEAN